MLALPEEIANRYRLGLADHILTKVTLQFREGRYPKPGLPESEEFIDSEGPLGDRGWVFQEELSATRRLCFEVIKWSGSVPEFDRIKASRSRECIA